MYFVKPEADTSAHGAHAVQLQEDNLCARVKKFNEHQINYITIENESLALFLERQHFEVYVRSSSPTVYGIHRPAGFPILHAY